MVLVGSLNLIGLRHRTTEANQSLNDAYTSEWRADPLKRRTSDPMAVSLIQSAHSPINNDHDYWILKVCELRLGTHFLHDIQILKGRLDFYE